MGFHQLMERKANHEESGVPTNHETNNFTMAMTTTNHHSSVWLDHVGSIVFGFGNRSSTLVLLYRRMRRGQTFLAASGIFERSAGLFGGPQFWVPCFFIYCLRDLKGSVK